MTEKNTKFCQSCGKEIDEKAEICVGCGVRAEKEGSSTKKTKGPIWKRWWFWVIAIFVLFVIIGAVSEEPEIDPAGQEEEKKDVEEAKEEEEIEEEIEVIEISATQLSKEYDENKVAADSKYKDELLKISGTIDDIGKDIAGTPYVSLEGREYSLFGVQCMFNRDKEEDLIELRKGQKIILKGEVSSEMIGNIIVKDCEIIE